ncbi:kinase-associated protein B [Oceanobacillus iheyensis HTE831]|uniref:Kinase-associated protein B n=1 Tax=Oceanobacillus iheyensis (strain DSM 14371 / CIP 107618 / JCM 11309 / KCTC 3954 / HTE831) TaxID=221109 RepID=Q8ENY3_OCEIH|nr:kinase-associated lipoprotein B [Oceanobacillus iheyensis]BAC14297.1 kinase-associated protein B [Oceanobacillus iheyensis HTE831]
MSTFNNGDIVKAHYKSGTYIGIIKEDRGQQYLVEVRAVLKHPLQGDLHNYGQTGEDVFFHERKALSYKEKMNVKKPAVHIYDTEEIPSYSESLQTAVVNYKEKLADNPTAFDLQCLKKLEQLEETHYKNNGSKSNVGVSN